MKRYIYILIALFAMAMPSHAKVDVSEIIFGHLQDSHEWHIAGDVVIPLPVIVYSEVSGWHVFMSNRLEHGEVYEGLRLNEETGKIHEVATAEEDFGHREEMDGTPVVDLSITKNVLELFFVVIIICSIIMYTANWYKKNGYKKAPSGFVGVMEVVVNYIDKEVVKPSIGHGYQRFSPYLITIFLFILTCNLMGLIPFFPGGANLTGNIAITMLCAITAWIAVNFFAPKEYYKSIFWPDVPLGLKVIPLMPTIEFIGVFTKPFSLTIRLFANILAGHIIILALSSIIFATWEIGPAVGAPMTVVSVAFCVFMNCLELLVAFVQAYVFTILTANFIGLAHNE